MLQPHTDTGPRHPERRYGLGVWLTVRDDALTMAYVEGADFGVRMLSGGISESVGGFPALAMVCSISAV